MEKQKKYVVPFKVTTDEKILPKNLKEHKGKTLYPSTSTAARWTRAKYGVVTGPAVEAGSQLKQPIKDGKGK